jgi:hypothetical protein
MKKSPWGKCGFVYFYFYWYFSGTFPVLTFSMLPLFPDVFTFSHLYIRHKHRSAYGLNWCMGHLRPAQLHVSQVDHSPLSGPQLQYRLVNVRNSEQQIVSAALRLASPTKPSPSWVRHSAVTTSCRLRSGMYAPHPKLFPIYPCRTLPNGPRCDHPPKIFILLIHMTL